MTRASTRKGLRARGLLATLPLLFLLLLGAGPVGAAVDAALSDRLRAAVRLPQVSLDYQFGMSRTAGWLMEDDPGDVSAAIAEIEARGGTGRVRAEALLQVARLSAHLGDSAAYAAAVGRAREAWQELQAAAPDDPGVLAGLGTVLDLAGDSAGAERALRRAVDLGPGRYEAWQAWAGFLSDRSLQALFPGVDQADRVREFQMGAPVPDGAAETALRHADEALAAADRAVELQPESPLPHVARARARAARQMAVAAAATGPVEEIRRRRALAALPVEAVPDLEAASARRPEDYRLHAAVIWHRHMPALVAAPSADASDPPVNRFPESERAALEDRLARLARLAESPRPWIAAGALEAMAICRFALYGDPRAGGDLARRALQRDPGRRQARDLALAMRVVQKDWPAVVELTSTLLKRQPDARLWLVRAKAEFEQGRLEAAREALEEGLKVDPSSAPLLAARFAFWLRSGDLPARALELRPGIEAAFDALRRVAGTPAGAALYQGFFPTTLIATALDGDLADARSRARRWVAENPEDAYGLSVLEILQTATP